MIQIDTSEISAEMRDNPEFVREFEAAFKFFNSERFDEQARTLLCLHEATHVVYARELGFEPRMYGPEIICDKGTFHRIDASVDGLPHELKMTAEPLAVAKSIIGPVYTVPILTTETEESMWKKCLSDRKCLVRWDCKRQLRDEKEITFEMIRESVHNDCRSPAFRRKLWDAAHEFEARVFGRETIPSRKAA